MITFENGIDARCRETDKPAVARFRVSSDEYRYIVIGTQYGYLHTSSGDVRTWQSASGARKAAKRYEPF
jgi:hypothetical protein